MAAVSHLGESTQASLSKIAASAPPRQWPGSSSARRRKGLGARRACVGPGDQQVDGAWSSRRIQRLGPGFQVIRWYSALTANINAIAEANTAAAARLRPGQRAALPEAGK